ncbi:hypothetical protein QM467_16675, partial [Rhodoblastus sp. 17X3]|uniref:hypothetical protein n=1 Tax=Rhodoblastus sp. 17X3 TaxID=3047026 RepID=UPI0024B81ABF
LLLMIAPGAGASEKSRAAQRDVKGVNCISSRELFTVFDFFSRFPKAIIQDRLDRMNAPPAFCFAPERRVNLAYTRRLIVPRHGGLDFRVAEHVA